MHHCVVEGANRRGFVINDSPIGLGRMKGPWATKRGFLTCGLAACMAGCAQPLVPEVQQPNWDMIKRNWDSVFIGPDFDRLKRVGLKVLSAPTKDGPWQFGVVKSEETVVLAFVGNGLIVSTQVLKLCENDGQLAALVAWVVNFPLPSTRISGPRNLTFDVSNATVIIKADIATLRTLALAGYDPRDALGIARRVPVSDDVQLDLDAQRFSAMESELRKLGYQV